MRLILKAKVPILLAFALVALIAAGCSGPDPTRTPNVPSPTPTPVTPAPAVPNEAPRNVIAFDMPEAYEKGEPVEIAIVNNSTDVYYYQHHYPACYNLQFFDDETEPGPFPIEVATGARPLMAPGRFIAPEGTHCDVVSEDRLQPGERAVLLVWQQHRCIVDIWGCRESVRVEPGSFWIEGRFSQLAGVLGPGDGASSESVVTAEWTFVARRGPTPPSTPSSTPVYRATIPAVILWVEPVGDDDFTAKLRAEIVGGLDNTADLYCQSFRWWLGNGIEVSYDGLCAHAWNADVI
jgi:hypothetical protein